MRTDPRPHREEGESHPKNPPRRRGRGTLKRRLPPGPRWLPAIPRIRELRAAPPLDGPRWLDLLLAYALVLPLAVATVNASVASYAAAMTTVLVLVLKLRRQSLRQLDYLTIVAAGWVLLTPLWSYAPTLSEPASHGGAMSLLYLVTVRLGVDSRVQFRRIVRLVNCIVLVYVGFFLVSAAPDAAGRLTLGFVNLNYTSAILAFGAATSYWTVLAGRDFAPIHRVVAAATTAAIAYAVLQTGSRAGIAGVLLAVAAITLMRGFSRIAHVATAALMLLAAFMPYIPGTDSLLASAATDAEITPALTRSGTHVTVLSGRESLWASTKNLISHTWLAGSGLDGYRIQNTPPVLAHSWGLDYLASVGVVGTILIATVVGASFMGWNLGIGLRGRRSSAALAQPREGSLLGRRRQILRILIGGDRSPLWNAATSLAILPSMALSTHQWTLWAWFAIALWSRSSYLDDPIYPLTDTSRAHTPTSEEIERG